MGLTLAFLGQSKKLETVKAHQSYGVNGYSLYCPTCGAALLFKVTGKSYTADWANCEHEPHGMVRSGNRVSFNFSTSTGE